MASNRGRAAARAHLAQQAAQGGQHGGDPAAGVSGDCGEDDSLPRQVSVLERENGELRRRLTLLEQEGEAQGRMLSDARARIADLELEQESNVAQLRNARRLIEEEREQLEQMTFNDKVVIENMEEGVVITDTRGHIIAVNSAFTRITGYALEEVIGRNPSILSSGLQSREFYRALWAQIETSGRWRGEIHNRRKNGELYIEYLSISAIRDWRGEVLTYVGVFMDLSQLKQAEFKYQVLFDATSDAVILFDKNRVLECNHAALAMFGATSADQLVGCRIGELSPERQPNGKQSTGEAEERFRQALEQGHRLFEWTHRRFDGREFQTEVLLNAAALKQQTIVQAVIRDISQRKKIEQKLREAKRAAEQASRAKSRFLAAMGHEFRTPLNAILGYGGLLAGAVQQERHENYRISILQAGRDLLEMVNDILELATLDLDDQVSTLEPVRLPLLLHEVEQYYLEPMERKGLRFGAELVGLPSGLFLLDAHRVRQVLVRLLDNAVKFTDQGYVRLRVRADEGVPAAAHRLNLWFDVVDSGRGISRELQSHLFELFWQEEAVDERRHGGTGIGLALSQGVARLIGGMVTFQENPEGGSQFSLVLPGVEWEPASGIQGEGEVPPADEGRVALEGGAGEWAEIDPERLRTLRAKLDGECSRMWDGARKSHAFHQITDFGRCLRELGEQEGCAPLIGYADRLIGLAERFDILGIEEHLERFRELARAAGGSAGD